MLLRNIKKVLLSLALVLAGGHHCVELFETDLSIAVNVCFLYHLFVFVISELNAQPAKW